MRRTIHVLCLALGVLLGPACGGGGGGGDIPPFTLYRSVAAGDVDGDGRTDLVYTSSYVNGPPPQPGYVTVLLQDPSTPGSFLPPIRYASGADPTSLALADLNGDGALDVVVGNSSADSVSIYIQDTVTRGHLKPPLVLGVGSAVNGVAVADLNGDGKPDIAVAAGNGIVLFFQDPANPGTFLAPVGISLGTVCGGIAIGDVDGDTKTDLVVTGSSNVFVLLQDPAHPGAFLPATVYTAGISPSRLLLQDLNGDGKPDLAVANEGPAPSGSQGSLSVLLQDAAHPGQFLPATPYATGMDSFSVAVGDLNGDGRQDLVVGNQGTIGSGMDLSVFIQDPANAGAFLAAQNLPLPVSGGAWGVAVADLNHDGALDIAVSGGSGGVLVFFQDPAHPGQFGPATVVGY